jgi:hypothetical protein
MSNRNHEQIFRVWPIDDAVWEATEDDPASSCQIGAAVLRKGHDATGRTFDLGEELGAKPGTLRLIPGHGFEKLVLGRRQEWNWVHLKSARAFAKTSSEETACTSPLR